MSEASDSATVLAVLDSAHANTARFAIETSLKLELDEERGGPTIVYKTHYRYHEEEEWRLLSIPGVNLFSTSNPSERVPTEPIGTARQGSDRKPGDTATESLQIERFASNVEPLTKALVTATSQLTKLAEERRETQTKSQEAIQILIEKITDNAEPLSRDLSNATGIVTLQEQYMKRLDKTGHELRLSDAYLRATTLGTRARDHIFNSALQVYNEAIDHFTIAERDTIDSEMQERKQTLVNLASARCPTDVRLVGNHCDSLRHAFMERFANAEGKIQDQRKDIASASFVSEVPGWPCVELESDAFARARHAFDKAAQYHKASGEKKKAFLHKYQSYDKAKDGQPRTVEDWTDVWSSPDYQVGQVRARNELVHPTDEPADREKAAISQYAVYSMDQGKTWRPIDSEAMPLPVPFGTPDVSAWHLMRPEVKLTDIYMLDSWKEGLESASRRLVKTSAVDSAEGDTATASSKTETRSELVARQRQETAASLILNEGITKGESLWSQALQKRRAAFEDFLKEDTKKAEAKTDSQKQMVDQWSQALRETLTRDGKHFLAAVHRTLAQHTEGDERSRHIIEAESLELGSQAAEGTRRQTEESLTGELQKTFGSSQIPTGGGAWSCRFNPNYHGDIPTTVMEAEAPKWLREARALELLAREDTEAVEYTRADDKSGGVPEAVQQVCLVVDPLSLRAHLGCC
ncbi:hypothetical protein IAU59_002782 [Kwoniella sp. CBS 9459]